MMTNRTPIGIILLIVGMILSVVGMVEYTGIAHWGIPSALMYVGYVVCIVGIYLLFMEFRENRRIIEDHYGGEEEARILGSVGDDDYCVNLTGQDEEDSKDPFVIIDYSRSESKPSIIDLTKEE